jgi:LmbE family N-acetylglucosaminyl deacetylase
MPKHFLGKRIAVLTAHPDDEGLAAGTMYENHKAGGETFLICATYGEKGKSHLKKPVSDARLKKIRKDELLKAARVLKIKKVLFLGFPDAGVRERKRELFEAMEKAVRTIASDQILSFGPEGISAHWDHITVGAAAARVAKKLKIPIATFTLSDAMIKERLKRSFVARRKFGKYAGIPQHRKANIRIKIDPMIKVKAMRNHRSQFGNAGPFPQLPERVRRTMFQYEYFVE